MGKHVKSLLATTTFLFAAVLFAASPAAAGCGASASSTDAGNGGGGDDAGDTCTGSETKCDGNSFQRCEEGAFVVAEQCIAEICDPTFGCVECTPNQPFCDGDTAVACGDTGQVGGVIEACEGDSHCSGGACRNLCADAEDARSYLGCEYWAADLDNALEAEALADSLFGCTLIAALTPGVVLVEDVRVCIMGDAIGGECDSDGTCGAGFTCQSEDVCALSAQTSPFAVVVSNPHEFVVELTIDNGAGTSMTTTVPAGEVTSIYPDNLGFSDQSIDGSGTTASAYRLRTSAPVAAYQFNPLDNENVFSNDGSLLIPRHTFDTDYYALTWEGLQRRPERKDFNGYVTVVAWKDATEVTVTPSADVRAGQSSAAIAAGTPTVFTLNAFDVLNLEAASGADLSGSRIQVTGGDEATVAVFAGHEAVNILNEGANCCADHLEEMMLPASTWGNAYAIARSEQRTDEADILRIMAQEDGTVVNISSAATCPTLAAGAFCEIEIDEDVEIASSAPVLIGHYLKSTLGPDPANPFGSIGSGDPSLAIAVPTEQFRSTYTFLVPGEYDKQYISVVGTVGAALSLDGADIGGQLTAMGANGLGAARIEVQPGQHTLNCTGGCGLEVYGYSSAVSYFFAGGLDLEQIVVD